MIKGYSAKNITEIAELTGQFNSIVEGRDAENANFIFVSNNAFPVKIESGDRRYLVLSCNGKHKGDFTYFNQLCKSFDESFYDNLLTFFIKRDITSFNIRNIPMTESKQDLIEASRTPIDQFICDNYNKLIEGMVCNEAIMNKPAEMKERAFQLQLKDKCERKQKRVDSSRVWFYVLKEDEIPI